MLRNVSKILVSFALCLGLALPTAQPISRTAKVTAAASTLFAVHAAYEVNAAYKRACKARDKKILKAQQAARKKLQFQPQQETQNPVAEEQELKPMTWQEFRSTPKYLKKHLNTKNLLASGLLLAGGGFFAAQEPKPARTGADRQRFGSPVPNPNAGKGTPPDAAVPTPSSSSRPDQAAATKSSRNLSGLKVNPHMDPNDPLVQHVLKQRSFQTPTPSSTPAAVATPTLGQFIKAESKQRPRNAVAQDLVTNFIRDDFHGEELEKQIVDLQAGLCKELFEGWITREDLTHFHHQLRNKSSEYKTILNDLFILSHPDQAGLFYFAGAGIHCTYHFQSCLFKRISDTECILFVHHKNGLYSYRTISTKTEPAKMLGFIPKKITYTEEKLPRFPTPGSYYQCASMHELVAMATRGENPQIINEPFEIQDLIRDKDQEILNAAVEILGRAGIEITLPTENEVAQKTWYLPRWATMPTWERSKALLNAQENTLYAALTKELVEGRMTIDDMSVFKELCRENRRHEDIFSAFQQSLTADNLKTLRAKIENWDEAQYGHIESYFYSNGMLFIRTTTGNATFDMANYRGTSDCINFTSKN